MRVRGLLLTVFALLFVVTLAALGMSVAASQLFPSLGVSPELATQLIKGLTGVLAFLTVLLLLLAVLLLRTVGAPIRRVSRAIMTRSQTGDLSRPVPDERLREVRLLVEAFNALQEFFNSRETELDATRSHLEEVSTRDPLTRLLDRTAASELLDLELRRSRRTSLPCSILIVDIDDFDAFNERHFRTTGDELLVELAGTLRTSLRSTDVVARWGGDELMGVLMDTGHEGAMHVARVLMDDLNKAQDRRTERVTVSIGVATAEPVGVMAAKDLWARAESAAAAARAAGGNRVESGV